MENQTQTLCRICFDVGHFSLNGYEVNIQGKNISIDEMIKRFSDVEFTNRNTPELICENCTHDLVQSYLFTEKILEADSRILGLTQLEEERLGYDQELHAAKEDVEEEFSSQCMEIQQMEDQTLENQNAESQDIEGQIIEDEQCDLIEESTESNIVEEVYIDSEISADEHEEAASPEEKETVTSFQMDPHENLSDTHLNYDLLEEEKESVEPRRKYQRRNRTDNEIDKNGSFVITQFACSTTAPGTHRNTNAEDTDEVTPSDVRIMNYETVEVKAGNMDVLNKNQHSELPIDDSRVYLCQYCPRAFSSSPFLVAHVRKTHGCKFCASLFEKAKDLYTHIREAHSKFECVVCGKEFVSNSNMRNHLKTVHKLKVPANISLISYKKQTEIEEEI